MQEILLLQTGSPISSGFSPLEKSKLKEIEEGWGSRKDGQIHPNSWGQKW